ncbi:MAG: Cas10/Cmr2 second palm domain-containing protein [Spirulina sp.]
MKLTVTVLDTTGIQSYIFGSNRLRENIGASYLVGQVTDAWVKQILHEEFGIEDPEASIETQDARLVYAGGGNTVLLFKSAELAIEFTKKLSLKVLKEAPGVNLVAAHRHDFEWDKRQLYDTVQEMMKHDLDVKKRSRIPSSPLLGLGVTADCQSTRLVAVDTSKSPEYEMPKEHAPYPISREIGKKLQAVILANQDLKQTIFDSKRPNPWDIPRDFDDFGRSKGEMSYIAVVHIDGNSMGKRFQEFGRGKSDPEYIACMRQLSESVKQAGMKALEIVARAVVDGIEDDVDQGGNPIKTFKKSFRIHEDKYLPFRPLVYGGDDVTFVCDGRIGLTLATRYLKEFENQEAADGKKLTACAGVCIVKAHYPFARAYELSEALCRSAKKIAKHDRILDNERPEPVSAIDWHIAASGLLGDLTEIREREYRSQDNKPLEMRPLLLAGNLGDWRNWENFKSIIKEFEGEGWKDKRNKVKALREVLRRGPAATKEFLTAYQLETLPIMPGSDHRLKSPLAEQGWLDTTCGYFDAIEAMDFYIPLEVSQ